LIEVFTMPIHSHRDPLGVLQKTYGYPSFRGNQAEVIDHVMAGKNAFVLMPTGGGKSLCYQIPALCRNGVGVIVSPLIALMQDQVAQLYQIGIPAAFVNSSLAGEERNRILKRAAAGDFRLLYFSPERVALGTPRNGSSAFRFLSSPSMKRTAFPSGVTSSGRSTGN